MRLRQYLLWVDADRAGWCFLCAELLLPGECVECNSASSADLSASHCLLESPGTTQQDWECARETCQLTPPPPPRRTASSQGPTLLKLRDSMSRRGVGCLRAIADANSLEGCSPGFDWRPADALPWTRTPPLPSAAPLPCLFIAQGACPPASPLCQVVAVILKGRGEDGNWGSGLSTILWGRGVVLRDASSPSPDVWWQQSCWHIKRHSVTDRRGNWQKDGVNMTACSFVAN